MWELDHKQRVLNAEDLILLNCGAEKDSSESVGQQRDQTSQSCNQPWIFIGRTDAEAEVQILWSHDVKSWVTGKDPDAGKDWGQKEKGGIEDGMIGWHHQLSGHEFVQTPGDSHGQGGLVCFSPWGHRGHNFATTQQIMVATSSTSVCQVPGTLCIIYLPKGSSAS